MTAQSDQHREIVSLDGQWTFALDPQDCGLAEEWFSHDLESAIQVPGSWEEQGYGTPPVSLSLVGWNKLHEYEGAAWYSRSVEVPTEWAGKQVALCLKGVRWRSRVWLDGSPIGEQESLSTPHRFDLTPYLKPGHTQRLAIEIDNRMIYPLSESHINSEQTATHWGGISGGAELCIAPLSAIQAVRCHSDVEAKAFHFDVELHNATNHTLAITVIHPETGETFTNQTGVQDNHTLISVELGEQARFWWDDDPFLYHVQCVLMQGDSAVDSVEKRVGLREFTAQGKQLLLNGKPVFLRGYVDCCIFPLTGYPTWDSEEYRRQFRIAQSYGFNHVRLHSWTPPEPFWEAADEYGMLVQTELPHWTAFYRTPAEEPPPDVHRFLMDELERIVAELNLHPSWVMFSNGNELAGAQGHPRLLELMARGKELDPTRLFTDNTGFGRLPAPGRTVDFYIQSCNWHPPKKIYDAASNDTTEDFSAITAQSDRPLIGHEHGQFTMYVRPEEAAKYTGVLRPTWLESVLPALKSKGLDGRIDDYIQASGIHIVRTYKENMERARRTPGLAGLQLLDIRDFPGQGHATTGILDMFWDSKGLVEPETFAQFNGAVTLLMRAPSPTFWNNAPIQVAIEAANYGHETLPEGILHWELHSHDDTTHLEGQVSIPAAPVGDVTPLNRLKITVPLDDRAHGWQLRVRLGEVTNSWDVWTFPYPQPNDYRQVGSRLTMLGNSLSDAHFTDNYEGHMLQNVDKRANNTLNPDLKLAISDRLSMRLLQYLHDGGCVWLMPDARQLYDCVRTRYLPPFWSYLLFPDNVSSVMGMLIPEHPLMKLFPHDGFSNWQWYNLVNDTPAICLDSVPFVPPVVEVVDNFNRAKRLAYAFEVQVGNGRLFVSTWRLSDPAVIGRPEAQFLLHETVNYLLGDDFAPAEQLSVSQLLGLFRLTNTVDHALE